MLRVLAALALTALPALRALPVQAGAGYGSADSCLERIAARESHGDWYAVNPASGAYGRYQILPRGGVYDSTPWAQEGISVYSLGPEQQTEVAEWILEYVGSGPWGGCG